MSITGDGSVAFYNGVSFGTYFKSKASTKPILDEAGRTTVATEHTLEIEGYVYGTTADGTDGAGLTLAGTRKALTACGGALIFTGKGYGDLIVNNGSTGVKDVSWGPKPEIVEWQPLGSGNAAKVVWRVTTRIPECANAKYQFGIMALNYTTTYSLDDSNYTLREIVGYLEVPMTRTTQDNRLPPDDVDNYRKLVAPPLPLGFKRRDKRFKVSPDLRRLDFTITDEEVPVPLPAGATKIDAKHRIKSNWKKGYRVWTVTIEATITLARGLPKTQALGIFLGILSLRTLGPGGNVGNSKFLMTDFEAEDDIFGRPASFSATFLDMRDQSLSSVMGNSGIWTPLPGTDYGKWSASINAYVNPERGYANLQDDPKNNQIIDLCQSQYAGAKRVSPATPP